jgi:antirestriction protein ArdC
MTGISRRRAIFQIRAGLSGYVAEITAGLVCSNLGLPNELHDSHASYLAHWLGILKADKTAIIHAAAKAEQAFAYLCGFAAAQDGEDEPLAIAA